jgi:cell division protein FtsI/penicillin-binding protein 2
MRSIVLPMLVMVVLLGGGAARLVYLEVTQGPALRERAQAQQTVTVTIAGDRGEILDARGRVLAGTVRKPSVFADPSLIADIRYAAFSVAPVLGMSPAALEALLRDPPQARFVWLKRRVSEEEVAALERVVEARRLAGFRVREEPTRVYPQGHIAPHVIGFVGIDQQGLAGVEQAYDAQLEGGTLEREVTVDVGRRRVYGADDGYDHSVDGATVVLTIDAHIQALTQEALAAAVAKHGSEWGAAVVMDPQTGEVLAMTVVPDFDPASAIPETYNTMSEDEREVVKARWRNRAIADSYEPGSIFKPFIASQALGDGVVQLDEVFEIGGRARSFGARTIHDVHGYDALPVYQIISKSSNIGMGLIGARCGNERLHAYVRAWGFGQVTGIGLPGEHTGQVNQLRSWTSFSTQSIPIGQEIAVTPIQVVTAFSAFCNGGWLLQPRIVRGVVGSDGQTQLDASAPIRVRRVLDPLVAEQFRFRALVETVNDGTGRRAQLDDWQAFGKTGTAQIALPNGGGYIPNTYVGSFVGGAPADVPRVVAIASIYKPTNDGYYGGVVAAPVVKEILAGTLAYLRVPPERTDATGDLTGERDARTRAPR